MCTRKAEWSEVPVLPASNDEMFQSAFKPSYFILAPFHTHTLLSPFKVSYRHSDSPNQRRIKMLSTLIPPPPGGVIPHVWQLRIPISCSGRVDRKAEIPILSDGRPAAVYHRSFIRQICTHFTCACAMSLRWEAQVKDAHFPLKILVLEQVVSMQLFTTKLIGI